MGRMLDAVIIGGGPGGMAAAVYLARQKLKFVMVTGTVGGQALWSADVEDYLGFHLLNGMELVNRFRAHLEDYHDFFELHEGEVVEKVEKMKGGFQVKSDHETYETQTVLIATGTKHRALNVPGEKELYGKGVTYCATCDAPLYKGKVVYVIGGGNSAIDAALFAAKYAAEVHLVSVNPELKGDAVMRDKIQASAIIQHLATKTTRLVGRSVIAGIGLMGPDGVEKIEKAEGVFVEIGLQPVADFIDFVGKDHLGQIMVDAFNATNVEGIWAAGDVTNVTEKQIAVAVGEGSKAALSLIRYLQSH